MRSIINFVQEYWKLAALLGVGSLVLWYDSRIANDWGNTASVLGLAISLYTFVEAYRARRAAEGAQATARDAVRQFQVRIAAAEVHKVAAFLHEIRSYEGRQPNRALLLRMLGDSNLQLLELVAMAGVANANIRTIAKAQKDVETIRQLLDADAKRNRLKPRELQLVDKHISAFKKLAASMQDELDSQWR